LEAFRAVLFDTCLYEPLDRENDTNKLCGISTVLLPKLVKYYGPKTQSPQKDWLNNLLRERWSVQVLKPWHYNSLRVGWVPGQGKNSGKIQLTAYQYHKGLRTITPLAVVEPGQEFYILLGPMPNSRKVQVSIVADGMKLGQHTAPFERGEGWVLGGYFGGDKPAPHTLHYYLERT
jgi:hypothetical protein